MKYSITIDDMTAGDLAAVVAFITANGATSAAPPAPPMSRVVAELAAATGATPTPPPAMPVSATPAPPAPVMTPPPAADPFSAPPAPPSGNGPAGPGETDSHGVIWDARFHAESKRKNKDGSWARRKGLDKAAADAYEASFARGARTAPTPPIAAQHPTAAEITAQHAPHLVTAPATQGAPDPFAQPPAIVTPPAPPAPAPVVVEVSYADWHNLYSNLVAAGKMAPEAYAEIATRHGAIDDVMKFYNDAAARTASYQDMMAIANA